MLQKRIIRVIKLKQETATRKSMFHMAKRNIPQKHSKYFLLWLVLLGLFSCSSSAPPLRYYLLHSVDPAALSGSLTFEKHVVIDTLVIPEYLKQASLVYQLSASELHVSPSHFWSEPVDIGINQIIREGLASDSIQLVSATKNSLDAENTVFLSLFVDDFLPTWQGQVILKGRYELKNGGTETRMKYFHYTHPLSEDGFEHSVLAMRFVIGSLTEDIRSSLEAM